MKKLLGKMRGHFDSQAVLREKVSEMSRDVIRSASRAISAIHRNDRALSQKFLVDARRKMAAALKLVKDDKELASSGIIFSAQQEYAEAELVRGIAQNGRLFLPDEIKVPYKPYLSGMADAVGELRRMALDSIREGDVKRAEATLKFMEEMFDFMMEFDYADAVLPGMRRKQDAARQIIEKTRGDLTMALRQERLERALREKHEVRHG
ncbi:MAG: translin family protein [Candidatus Hadarchaeota archaeon]